MQSTGQTSTQLASFVPIHGSAIMYVMKGYIKLLFRCEQASEGANIKAGKSCDVKCKACLLVLGVAGILAPYSFSQRTSDPPS